MLVLAKCNTATYDTKHMTSSEYLSSERPEPKKGYLVKEPILVSVNPEEEVFFETVEVDEENSRLEMLYMGSAKILGLLEADLAARELRRSRGLPPSKFNHA